MKSFSLLSLYAHFEKLLYHFHHLQKQISLIEKNLNTILTSQSLSPSLNILSSTSEITFLVTVGLLRSSKIQVLLTDHPNGTEA